MKIKIILSYLVGFVLFELIIRMITHKFEIGAVMFPVIILCAMVFFSEEEKINLTNYKKTMLIPSIVIMLIFNCAQILIERNIDVWGNGFSIVLLRLIYLLSKEDTE